MAGRGQEGTEPWDPQEERIRRVWLALLAALATLVLAAVLDLVVAGPSVTNLLVLASGAVAAVAAAIHRRELSALEHRRRIEAEGVARMLRVMSRSVSPDSIIEAIVHELGTTILADHLVVVRLRQSGEMLEATLFTASGNAPVSSTVVPFLDEDDEREDRRGHGLAERVALAADEPALIAVGPGPTPNGTTSPAVEPTGRPGLGRGRQDRLVAGSVADRIAARVGAAFGLKNTIAAPLVTPTGVVGAIVVSRRTADPWPLAAKRLLAGAAVEASAALVRAYSHREAEEKAATDALTGLPNRRYFEEVCGLWARRRRDDRNVGVVMIDIDHFKVLNDTYGHSVGDEVLREVAQAIVRAVREDDIPARYGGEEFVVLLRDPVSAVAEVIGERIRTAVRDLDLSALGVGPVTVSVGVAVAEPGEAGAVPIADVLDRADRALYDAKRAGRDRVVATVG